MSDPTADPRADVTAMAQQYAAACKRVLAAANAGLEVANQAVGARNMAAQRPQAEMSIQTFANLAEEKEREFAPLNGAFADACANARRTAKDLLSAQTDEDPEIVLAMTVGLNALDDVARVKVILGVDFGTTPAGFVEGIEKANALIQDPTPTGGNIYTPADQTCPWCAETIKAAAVVCRFCGRDVQEQPNADGSN